MAYVWKYPPHIIAHRGASGDAPENTLAAFAEAAKQGAKWVEFDVKLTKDGIPVVFHDDILERLCGDKRKVNELTFDELQAFDLGTKQFPNQRIPSLAQVCDALGRFDLMANIELKPNPGEAQQTAAAVNSLLKTSWPHPQSLPLVSSFSEESLQAMRKLNNEVPLGYLVWDWKKSIVDKARTLKCATINLPDFPKSLHTFTKERVKLLQDAGFSVLAYTVNKPKRAMQFLDWGVDGIFTDYPKKLLDALASSPSNGSTHPATQGYP